MEVNSQLHVPASLPSEKEPHLPIGEKAGWDVLVQFQICDSSNEQ
jgi:hypothetical protein